ncbi:YraN family protein [Aquabacterium sp.]|uniref:YraN family protein n=1 Tax=Aquabacterium sp. TaxID=1872578 RepID=UPI003784D7C3
MVTTERGRSGRTGAGPQQARPTARQVTGNQAEQRALDHLQRQGLRLVERNYRLAGGPFARGAEIDLILREPDGTLVFVEVRARAGGAHGPGGGAAASVTTPKQRRIVRAARHYLLRLPQLPPCRFDVVAIEGEQLHWLRAAFDAD